MNLTLFRSLLALIVFIVLVIGNRKVALYLFVLAAFLSFFERFVAKKQKSALRSIFDLLADKLLVNFAALALAFQGLMPIWIAAIFLGRDLLTILGGAFQYYKDSNRIFAPTILGKVMLFLQIVSILPVIYKELDWILASLAILFTVLSAIELIFRSEFKIQKRSDIGQFFRMKGLIKIADLFTLLNIVFGMVAIVLAIKGEHVYSMLLLLAAAIIDFFDGKIARILKQQNVFGKELDSLADTISFGVAPAVIGFTLLDSILALFAFTIFLFCGVLRLARFNIMQAKESYEGMPITLNGVLIPLIYFAHVPILFYPYIYIGLGILMISSLRFKKL